MALKNFRSSFFLHIFICLSFLSAVILTALPLEATELPEGIKDYVDKTFPGANIRFDGVIELSDGDIYIPVIPVAYAQHEGDVRTTMTLPENVSRPDLIVFSNNLSLLRVITNKDGEKTILSGTQVPLRVKLGLLPQDMIVPEGLVIPSDMTSIVGDLVIPSTYPDMSEIIGKSTPDKNIEEVSDELMSDKPDLNADNVSPVTETVVEPDVVITDMPVKMAPLAPAEDVDSQTRLPGLNSDSLFGLSNRLIYLTAVSGNKVYLVDPQMSKIIDEIQVSPLPVGMVISPDKKRIYAICLAGNSIASIDVKMKSLENMIKVGLRPSSIAITPDGSKILVTNTGSGNVSVINTELFEIINTLDIQGMPDGVVASLDNRSFYVFNRSSGIVSKWDSLDFNNRQFLFMVRNPTAMAIDSEERRLYVTSRTEDNLMIYDLKEKKYSGFVKVGKKPVGVAISRDGSRVYTLNAGDDAISVIDVEKNEILETVDLLTGGFPGTITMIPGTNKALITNAESDKITLVDLDNYTVITTLPVGITTKSLLVGPTPQEIIQAQKQEALKQQESETTE